MQLLLNHFFKNVWKSVLQDALQTFFQNVLCSTRRDIFQTVMQVSSRFANPTFLRRLKGILQRCFQSVFYHWLENYLAKISKNCLCEMSYIPLYEMSFRQLCKIRSRFAYPTSFRRLKDILPRCLDCLHKTSLRLFFSLDFLPISVWYCFTGCRL